MEGVISIIGFLGGADSSNQPGMLDALSHCCAVRGILVGSREQFEAMNKFIEKHDIKSVVDEKVFGFEDAKDAYHYLWGSEAFRECGYQSECLSSELPPKVHCAAYMTCSN
jgi:D-arabinose 1-dehydrogenase-like Zn-dependent alcohol dehydrogenase